MTAAEPTCVTDSTREFYNESAQSLQVLLRNAVSLSRRCAQRYVTDPKLFTASVLFTRICNSTASVLWNCPGHSDHQVSSQHYDSSSVGSLARNLIECCIVFQYLCVDNIPLEEWKLRREVFNIHDCNERLKMFQDLDENDLELPGFRQQLFELQARLQLNSFRSLSQRRQTGLLKGDKPFVKSKGDIVSEMGFDASHFKAMYRFLSVHVHSSPMSFYRMSKAEGRGTGVENEVDVAYMGIFCQYANGFVEKCIAGMEGLFAEILSGQA